MNLVFLVGGYYPRFSAVGNCVGQITTVLSKEQTVKSINVISEQKDLYESKEDTWLEQSIHRVLTKRTKRRLNLIQDVKSNKFLSKPKLFIHKFRWLIKTSCNKYGFDMTMVNVYLSKLNELKMKSQIDVIIPCCMPIEAVYASYLFCNENKEIILMPLMFDLYSESDIYFRKNIIKQMKNKKALELESKIFDSSNSIFYVDNWDNYFEKHKYSKAIRIEHPLIYKKQIPELELKNKKKINLIYQGEVSYEMRNPVLLIDFLNKLLKLDKSKNIGIHICSFGNAYDKFNVLPNSQVELYGKVPKETADGYFADADVNIVIANHNKSIIPSKIYECISCGKPLIYFYNTLDDAVNNLLKNYENKYLVNQKDFDKKEIKGLIDWLNINYKKRLDYKDIYKAYKEATPEYVSEIIMSTLESLYE